MSDDATAPKHPRLAELEGMVRDGRIDTLVVAITDMQGRLMGKRVQAQAFLDGVIDHGAHFCTYLLGTDMEMNTPEGFRLMNWETGYGDWIADAGLGHAAGPAVAREDGDRPVATRSTRRRHEEIPISPRTILKRQVARGRGDGAHASRPAPSSSTTSSRTRGRRSAEQGLRARPSGSATTTRTTTCSRRRRPSRSTGSCATR